MRATVQSARLVAALAVVAGIVFCVPLADAVFFADDDAGDLADVRFGVHAESVLHAASADEVLESIERFAMKDGEPVSEWFQAEVGLLPDARDVRSGNGGRVVGYVVDCGVDEALASLEAHMEALGWTGVPLGQGDGFTFVKSSGRCTWALATCTRIGSATSVVLRVL